jgi:uncharacterized cupin superfamily protein
MSGPTIHRFEANGPGGKGLQDWGGIPAESLVSGTPHQNGHSYVNVETLGFKAGVWDCTAMTGKMEPYPCHEFMIVLEGSVTMIEENGRETTIKAGESFVLPKGLVCQWKQPGYIRKFYVIWDDPGGAAPKDAKALQVLKPDPKGKLEPAAATPPELLLSGKPVQHSRDWFVDPTGQWSVGVWDSTAYHRKAVPFPRYELMSLLEGAVTITEENGRVHRFKAGDTFFIEQGCVSDFKTDGYVRKFYCIFQPKKAAAKSEAAE